MTDKKRIFANEVTALRIVFMGTPEFAIPSLEMLVREGYEWRRL